MMWNEHGLGSADYVWWMRIMWRLHSCTTRGLCDNSRNWTHRFHVCATWNDLITAASGKSSLGRFNHLSICNRATERHLAPCDNNRTSGTFLRRHVSRDERCWSFDDIQIRQYFRTRFGWLQMPINAQRTSITHIIGGFTMMAHEHTQTYNVFQSLKRLWAN